MLAELQGTDICHDGPAVLRRDCVPYFGMVP